MDTQEASLNFVRETADVIRLNNWIFDLIYPYIKGRTLELGSVSGGIASFFIERDLPIHLTENDKIKRGNLQKKFEGRPAMRMIHNIDFNDALFEQVYAD